MPGPIDNKDADFDQLSAQLNLYKNATPRDRIKIGKSAGFIADTLFKKSSKFTETEITLLQSAFEKICAHHSYPQRYQAMLAQVALLRQEMSGHPAPDVLMETCKTIDVEMGGIIVTSREVIPEPYYAGSFQKYSQARLSGQFFDIGIGGDGLLKIRVQFVSGTQPLLPEKYYRRLKGSTPIGNLNSADGTYRIFGGGDKSLSIEITHAPILIQGYRIGQGRSAELLLIMCENLGKSKYQALSRPELLF